MQLTIRHKRPTIVKLLQRYEPYITKNSVPQKKKKEQNEIILIVSLTTMVDGVVREMSTSGRKIRSLLC